MLGAIAPLITGFSVSVTDTVFVNVFSHSWSLFTVSVSVKLPQPTAADTATVLASDAPEIVPSPVTLQLYEKPGSDATL
jgi:hypothetical protein